MLITNSKRFPTKKKEWTAKTRSKSTTDLRLELKPGLVEDEAFVGWGGEREGESRWRKEAGQIEERKERQRQCETQSRCQYADTGQGRARVQSGTVGVRWNDRLVEWLRSSGTWTGASGLLAAR